MDSLAKVDACGVWGVRGETGQLVSRPLELDEHLTDLDSVGGYSGLMGLQTTAGQANTVYRDAYIMLQSSPRNPRPEAGRMDQHPLTQ